MWSCIVALISLFQHPQLWVSPRKRLPGYTSSSFPQSHLQCHLSLFLLLSCPTEYRTVSRPNLWPVKSRLLYEDSNRLQPQLRVRPLFSCNARTTVSFPQLHRHSQQTLPYPSFSTRRIAVSSPNCRPVRSSASRLEAYCLGTQPQLVTFPLSN